LTMWKGTLKLEYAVRHEAPSSKKKKRMQTGQKKKKPAEGKNRRGLVGGASKRNMGGPKKTKQALFGGGAKQTPWVGETEQTSKTPKNPISFQKKSESQPGAPQGYGRQGKSFFKKRGSWGTILDSKRKKPPGGEKKQGPSIGKRKESPNKQTLAGGSKWGHHSPPGRRKTG